MGRVRDKPPVPFGYRHRPTLPIPCHGPSGSAESLPIPAMAGEITGGKAVESVNASILVAALIGIVAWVVDRACTCFERCHGVRRHDR